MFHLLFPSLRKKGKKIIGLTRLMRRSTNVTKEKNPSRFMLLLRRFGTATFVSNAAVRSITYMFLHTGCGLKIGTFVNFSEAIKDIKDL